MRVKTGLGSRGKLYRMAHEAYIRSGEHAFRGRKEKKRDFRRLWIQRINGGLKSLDNPVKYSVFIKDLNESKIDLNRKMLSEIAFNDFDSFQEVVKKVSK